MSNAGSSGVEAKTAEEGSELSAKLQSSQWRTGEGAATPRHAEADFLLIESAVQRPRNPQSAILRTCILQPRRRSCRRRHCQYYCIGIIAACWKYSCGLSAAQE
jgi:hypothetical protein